MEFEILEKYINTESINQAIKMIKELGKRKDVNAVEFLTEFLFEDYFEVSRQSLLLIESCIQKVPFEIKTKVYAKG